MDRLRFGTAGIPISTPDHSTSNGIRQVRALGLDCMELEFVHNVNIPKEKAPSIRKIAQDEDIVLTCHGPYYINLNAIEQKKREQSRERMITASARARECGAWSIAFHLGFYLGQEKEIVYKTVKKEVQEVAQTLKDNGVTITLRAETTGKPTQFGDIKELLQMSTEVDNLMPCIDFAHLHARTGGKINTYGEFADVLALVEKMTGKEGLHNMHIHIAGIAYSEKGEKNHLPLQESDMNYQDLVRAWKEFKIKGVLISESPNIEQDGLLLKKIYLEG